MISRSIPASKTQSSTTSKSTINRSIPAVSSQLPVSSPTTRVRPPNAPTSASFSLRKQSENSSTETSGMRLSPPRVSPAVRPPVTAEPFSSLAECVTAEKMTIYQCIQSLQYELRLLQDFSSSESDEEVFASFREAVTGIVEKRMQSEREFLDQLKRFDLSSLC